MDLFEHDPDFYDPISDEEDEETGDGYTGEIISSPSLGNSLFEPEAEEISFMVRPVDPNDLKQPLVQNGPAQLETETGEIFPIFVVGVGRGSPFLHAVESGEATAFDQLISVRLTEINLEQVVQAKHLFQGSAMK